MTNSDWISLAAFFIAILSAIYSRNATNEAKRSNKLTLHFKMVEIYEEVLNFSDCFRGIFTVPSAQRLENFRLNAVRSSELYFSEEIVKSLKDIYSHCSEQETWLSIAEGRNPTKIEGVDLPSDLEIRSEYKYVLNMIYPTLDLMKKEINKKMA